MKLAAAALALILSACAAVTPVDVNPRIAMEEFRVASEPGIDLYVRNKHAAGQTRFTGDRIVVLLHGATYPGETTFDMPFNGKSWMDQIAAAGYDVYMFDVRGYGKSGHAGVLDRPAQDNPPFATTEDGLRDFTAVVDFILKRRGVDRLNIIGFSWGSRIALWYAGVNPDKVSKLALPGPAHIRRTASPIPGAASDSFPAYRMVEAEPTRKRWLTGLPADADVIPKGWFEAWAAVSFPAGTIKAPNGVLFDAQRYWNKGVVPYKPEDVRAPVLLIHGDWDQETPAYMSHELLAAMKNARSKQYVQVREATHFMMLEKNRGALFRHVQAFLDERQEPEN